jgi:hypothetical protein
MFLLFRLNGWSNLASTASAYEEPEAMKAKFSSDASRCQWNFETFHEHSNIWRTSADWEINRQSMAGLRRIDADGS